MNRELLEALGAVAADVYLDAIHRHPGLFHITGVVRVTDDDLRLFPVLLLIDELLLAVDTALEEPPDPPSEPEDIPF